MSEAPAVSKYGVIYGPNRMSLPVTRSIKTVHKALQGMWGLAADEDQQYWYRVDGRPDEKHTLADPDFFPAPNSHIEFLPLEKYKHKYVYEFFAFSTTGTQLGAQKYHICSDDEDAKAVAQTYGPRTTWRRLMELDG